MLKDVLLNTRNQLETYLKAQNRDRDNSQFKTNLTKALRATSDLDLTLNLLSEAKNQQILQPSFSPDLRNSLLTVIFSLQGQLRDGYFGDSDVREIGSLSGIFRNEINMQWKVATTRKAEQVTSSLRLLGHFMENPTQATLVVSKLATWMQGLPTSATDIKAFAYTVDQGQKMLDSAGFDFEINTFVQKVRNNQATLADITPKVHGWIQKQHLESRVKVSF